MHPWTSFLPLTALLLAAVGTAPAALAIVSQCSDGADNDLDGFVDYPLDAGCTDPLDDDEGDGASGGTLPECSDGQDNQDPEDTEADAADPGCHSDNDASNPASYDPTDPQELSFFPQKQCSDGADNADTEDAASDRGDPGCYSLFGGYSASDDDETDSGRGRVCWANAGASCTLACPLWGVVQAEATRTNNVGTITTAATGPCVLAAVSVTAPPGHTAVGPLAGFGIITCTVTAAGGAIGWGACYIP